MSENDGLPDKICHSCLGEVKQFASFGQKCKSSDKKLRKMQRAHTKAFSSVIKEEKPDEYEGGLNEPKAEVYCEAFNFEDGDGGNTFDDGSRGPISASEESEMDSKFIPRIKLEKEPPLSFDAISDDRSLRYYECNYCHLTFKLKKSVKRHFPRCSIYRGGFGKVEPESSRQCDKCLLQFSSTRGLKFHLDNNKCGDASLLCKLCNYVFSTKKALHRHSFLHQSERYGCDVCTQTFRRPDLLNQHKRKEHEAPDPEARQFVCQFCGLKVKSQKSLDRHCISLHNVKSECDLCQQTFESPKELKEHRKVEHKVKHEQEKAAHLACETCGRMFNSKWKLKEHLLIHSAERPHLCKMCGLG